MRVRIFPVILAFAAMAAACKPKADVASMDKRVNIDLECLDDGGFTATISPWRVELVKNGSIKWILGKVEKVNEAEIKPTRADHWPFVEPSFKTKPGKPAEGKNQKADAAPGIYKYTISTICYRDGGVQDTVIIDPDMILPPPGAALDQ